MAGRGAPEVSQLRMTDMPSITVLSWGPLVMLGAMPGGATRRTATREALPSAHPGHGGSVPAWRGSPSSPVRGVPPYPEPARGTPGFGGTRGGLAPTGHGQVRGGLHLAGRVAGEALEHAGVVGEQPADLQAAVRQQLEAGQLLGAEEGRVLVPGHFGGRHACEARGCVTDGAAAGTGPRGATRRGAAPHLWLGTGWPPPSPSRP